MQVKDIMTKDVIAVFPETKIKEISNILVEKRIHGIPVINNYNQVIGIITEIDLFVKGKNDIYIPSFIEFLEEDEVLWKATENDKARLKKILNATANDVMTKNCITISYEADTKELLQLFKEKKLYTIPVIENNNILCGIVTLSDLVPFIKI